MSRLLSLSVIYLLAVFYTLPTTTAWYTGPDGKKPVDGTPEYQANKYLRKIFNKYGVDFEVRHEMGQRELAELMLNIGLGIIHKLPKSEKTLHDDHGDRKKRSSDEDEENIEPQGLVAAAFADSVSSIPHFHENISSTNTKNTTCRSSPLLLKEYNLLDYVTMTDGITPYEFGMLCPSLLYLSDENTCIELELEIVKEKPTSFAVWGYGILSITVISLLSFLGVAIVPLISSSFFQSLLSVLVAGAVGALTGDALLHLLPHSQASSHSHSKEPVFKNLIVLLGIYFLFVVEGVMKLSHHKKDRKKQKKKRRELSFSKTNPNGNSPMRSTSTGSDECVCVEPDDKQVDEEEELHLEVKSHGNEKHGHDHGHDHGNLEGKGIASVAWMVIAGDGMHNFSDGVAIGAAFTASLVGGMSTSVAVFCHELPHELGDFAMLIKSGMTTKQALFYNGAAACLGYLGMVLGILIGNYAATVTPWIFAITAGMFLYVALVDMLPEMNSGMHTMKTRSATSTFILQNIGLLVGIGIMLLIALFEENIAFE